MVNNNAKSSVLRCICYASNSEGKAALRGKLMWFNRGRLVLSCFYSEDNIQFKIQEGGNR